MWTGIGCIIIIIAICFPGIRFLLQMLASVILKGGEAKEDKSLSEKTINIYNHCLQEELMTANYREEALKEKYGSLLLKSGFYDISGFQHLFETEYSSISDVEVVVSLVYSNIYVKNEDFNRGFILVLLNNPELIYPFALECSISNNWMRKNNKVYQCKNYLKDFMSENKIYESINSLSQKEIDVPSDLRHMRPDRESYAGFIKSAIKEHYFFDQMNFNRYLAKEYPALADLLVLIVLELPMIYMWITDSIRRESWGVFCIALFVLMCIVLVWVNYEPSFEKYGEDKSTIDDFTQRRKGDDSVYADPIQQLYSLEKTRKFMDDYIKYCKSDATEEE